MPRYGGKGVWVDDSVFAHKAKKLARRFKVDEFDFVKEQSALLARDMAKMTPPYASFPSLYKGTSIGTKKDIERGEEAVFYDMLKISLPKKWAVINWAKSRFGGGPIISKKKQIGAGVIDQAGDLHAWKKRHEKPNGRTGKLDKQNKVWVPEDVWHSYVKEIQEHVGVAKAALWKASVALGHKGGALRKIKRHAAIANGTGTVTRKKKGPYGDIAARADGVWHTNKHLPALQRNRLIKAYKRLKILARAATQGSGFKVR